MDTRPILSKAISLEDFQKFYWLKEELLTFCRQEGLSTQGGKLEIAARIEHFLTTGQEKKAAKRSKPKSTFDWSREALSDKTVITDNYKNTENVRAYFKQCIGPQFKFNVEFMNWMKANLGKTLGEAVSQYKTIRSNAVNNHEKVISPQFEYNTYLRDFLKDNPECDRKLGIQLWNIKRKLRGSNVYSSDDFDLLN